MLHFYGMTLNISRVILDISVVTVNISVVTFNFSDVTVNISVVTFNFSDVTLKICWNVKYLGVTLNISDLT